MVNPDTGLLEYLYLPQTDAFVRERCPIREIASVWDVERLGRFLNRRELLPLVERSLRHYDDYLVEREGCLIVDPARLAEPSSIAHSAFMILALTGAQPPRETRRITALADGILRQQRPDGSYKVYFHDLPDQGEEIYAGEAMLALLETCRQAPDTLYLESVERGFSYYDARLVVAVPESEFTGVASGTKVNFTVPAMPGEQFTGVVRRISHALDAKTRTMPVELDVDNSSKRLAPGMFPEVSWPARRPRPSLFVPPAAVATTTERTFVIRVREGQVEWIDVKRGVAMNQQGGDLVEVFGDLAPGDQIAARGTDELRPGLHVAVKKTTASR